MHTIAGLEPKFKLRTGPSSDRPRSNSGPRRSGGYGESATRQDTAATTAVDLPATKPVAVLPVKPELIFTTARLTAVITMPDAKRVMVSGTVKPTVTPATVIRWGLAVDRVLADKVAARVPANRAARNAVSATIAVAIIRRAAPVTAPSYTLGRGNNGNTR